jgi:thiamine-monophosphate kinase
MQARAGKGGASRAKSLRAGNQSEQALTANIRQRAGSQARNSSLVLGIGDDCAVLRLPRGEELVATTDLCLENVHFRRDWHPAESVGHRCLARGLSDLAAMGARPLAAFLSIGLPRALRGTWLTRFLDGFLALANEHGVPLAGGDTAESPAEGAKSSSASFRGGLALADIVLLGSVPAGRALRRSGPRPGDLIYVTGALGGAASELRALARHPAAFRAKDGALHPHLYPQPRIAVGRALVGAHLATGAIDLSDGLSTDLAHLCEESGLSAVIDAEAVPVYPGATLRDALNGGEDYELLFTAAAKTVIPRRLRGLPIHAIGQMANRGRQAQVRIRTREGKTAPLEPRGWEHFKAKPGILSPVRPR